MEKYRIRKYHYRNKKPYKPRRKKLRLGGRFFWLFVLALIVLGAVFYLFLFSPIFQLKEIRISGNQKVRVEDIQEVVSQKSEKRIVFFATRSIFLIKPGEIEKGILEGFPQISQAKLKKKLPGEIVVQIEERKPVGIWCREECFYLDEEGVIFEKSGEEGMVINSRLGDSQGSLGERAIEKKFMDAALKIKKNLKENSQVDVGEVSIVSEERLNIKAADGWEAYFDLSEDLDWQLEELELILKEKIPPEKRGELEYIDLRFEKIYIFPEIY